jgi:hypothetical protein
VPRPVPSCLRAEVGAEPPRPCRGAGGPHAAVGVARARARAIGVGAVSYGDAAAGGYEVKTLTVSTYMATWLAGAMGHRGWLAPGPPNLTGA